MRPEEYLAIRWQGLDLEAGTACVERTVRRVKGGKEFCEPKTPMSRRTIPLSPELVAALREHKSRQAAHALRMGASYDREMDLVFANEVGHILDPRNFIPRHFKKALEDAGLPLEIRLYDLRHTFATLSIQVARIPVKTVAKLLGHASAKMTLDTYSHVLDGDEEEAVVQLGAILFG